MRDLDGQGTLNQMGASVKKAGACVGKLLGKVNPDVWREFRYVSLSAYSVFLPRQEPVEHREEDGYPPVVLVHGLGGNRGTWLPMRLFLKLQGHERVYAFGYGPGSVEEHAEGLVRFVDSVIQETGQDRVDVIAHSLGGIVARYALQRLDLHKRTRTFISLAVPHQGTWAAWYANTPMTRALRPKSDLIRQLNEETVCNGSFRFIAVYSDRDIYVVPAEGMMHPEAENLFVPGLSHSQYLVSPKVFRLVASCLAPEGQADDCREGDWAGLADFP